MAKSFSITSEDAKAATSSGAVPEGEYVLEIIDTKIGAFKSQANAGLPKSEVQFRISESLTDEGVGRKLRDFNVPLERKWKNGKVNFNFDQFWIAAGVIPEAGGDFEIPETDDEMADLIGTEVKALVVIGDNGYNEIKRYYPPSHELKPRGGTAAAGDAGTEEKFSL